MGNQSSTLDINIIKTHTDNMVFFFPLILYVPPDRGGYRISGGMGVWVTETRCIYVHAPYIFFSIFMKLWGWLKWLGRGSSTLIQPCRILPGVNIFMGGAYVFAMKYFSKCIHHKIWNFCTFHTPGKHFHCVRPLRCLLTSQSTTIDIIPLLRLQNSCSFHPNYTLLIQQTSLLWFHHNLYNEIIISYTFILF